jgi:hypothetical protein
MDWASSGRLSLFPLVQVWSLALNNSDFSAEPYLVCKTLIKLLNQDNAFNNNQNHTVLDRGLSFNVNLRERKNVSLKPQLYVSRAIAPPFKLPAK